MSGNDQLTDEFERNRPRLRAVANRMLGSPSDADDAVQETWLRLHRTDPSTIASLDGWLTTVTGRICLDMLRARSARRKDAPAGDAPELVATGAEGANPADEVALADSVGDAMMVVLDSLTPAERLAFVLHDLFGVAFEDIAPVVDRSIETTRQLASRARRRIRESMPPSGSGSPAAHTPDDQTEPAAGSATERLARQRDVIRAFLRASRDGDFAELLRVLDPDIVFRADATAVRAHFAHPNPLSPNIQPELIGARAVAKAFAGKARAAGPAIINGVPGFVWAPRGIVRVAFRTTFTGDSISSISIVANPDDIAGMAITLEEG